MNVEFKGSMVSGMRRIISSLGGRCASYGAPSFQISRVVRESVGMLMRPTTASSFEFSRHFFVMPHNLQEAKSSTDSFQGYNDMTPKMVVDLLDRHIVGQGSAKRSVSIALRNRWRRHRIPESMKDDVVPKNILMIGPTGCGKTEIARRLAKLADAPFIKVEATKFTEVGFHGRDVDQIIRDLVDIGVNLTRAKLRRKYAAEVKVAVENTILKALVGKPAGKEKEESSTTDDKEQRGKDGKDGKGSSGDDIESWRNLLRSGDLHERSVEIEVPEKHRGVMEGNAGITPDQVVVRLFNHQRKGLEKRSMKISEALPIVEEMELEKLMNPETLTREAIANVEQDGIVFIDEIDKIVSNKDFRHGADASSEGVQRDLLPIIEGSCISTKHGNVNTDHILFICSGAFHSCKPSDMLAELQGRLPIRVELKGLTREDLYRILTEPTNNIIRQQQALMETEGLNLHFTEAALQEVASIASEVNRTVDNIGARRLHTVLERIIEEYSFDAPDLVAKYQENNPDGKFQVVVDKEDVIKKLSPLLKKADMSKFIL